MMKGPSLDAIKRFQEQQERKKREEDERRIQEKLSTLEHRAAQGDRKAKTELKKIEKIQEERKEAPAEPSMAQKYLKHTDGIGSKKNQAFSEGSRNKPKPKPAITDFEELMRLAKQNKNEVRKEKEFPKLQTQQQNDKHSVRKPELSREPGNKLKQCKPRSFARESSTSEPNCPTTRDNQRPASSAIKNVIKAASHRPDIGPRMNPDPRAFSGKLSSDSHKPTASIRFPGVRTQELPSRGMPPTPHIYGPPGRRPYRRYYDDDDDDFDDDYEQDDFVVDDEDDDAQDELSKTIRSVFRYDKRRCDRREEELDRQYRAIGRVSTFEDLEREERRASRLAAAEDAHAQREEDERKRLKKARLSKMGRQ